jgi:hypothetical protein
MYFDDKDTLGAIWWAKKIHEENKKNEIKK